MRVLLDENLPVDLAKLLDVREVQTVSGLGWVGVTNGDLLKRMQGRFDALVTMDRNLPHQQKLEDRPFGVVLVHAPSNRLEHLEPLVPPIRVALKGLQAGELRRVGA